MTADGERVAAQLQRALASRVALEQAKGVLAERAGVTMDDALDLIRRYAAAHHQDVHNVTAAVVEGRLDLSLLAGPQSSPPDDV
jgi:AmiR/NasT family two-component response regulator